MNWWTQTQHALLRGTSETREMGEASRYSLSNSWCSQDEFDSSKGLIFFDLQVLTHPIGCSLLETRRLVIDNQLTHLLACTSTKQGIVAGSILCSEHPSSAFSLRSVRFLARMFALSFWLSYSQFAPHEKWFCLVPWEPGYVLSHASNWPRGLGLLASASLN